MMRGKLKRPRFDEDTRPDPVIIASFTYKGGVGKTTISLNFAADLAIKGYRVGLVDCDSQCNLSTFFNPQPKPEKKAVDEGEEEEPSDDEARSEGSISDGEAEAEGLRVELPSLESFKVRQDAHTYNMDLIKQGCYDSTGTRFPVTIKTLWEEAKDDKEVGTAIIDLHNFEDFKDRQRKSTLPDGLFLVPGDPDLSSAMEGPFYNARQAMHQRGSTEPFRVLSAFRRSLHHVGRVHNLQYMICDFGPSAGLLNQVLVMSCDYILPCFQPDFFSASAVYGFLHNVMPVWMDFFGSVRDASKRNLTDPRFAFNPLPPRILPFLMNNFVLEGKDWLTLMDSAFFTLVERIVDGEGCPVPEDIRALFLPDGNGYMVFPFLRSVPVALKVAQEVAQPAVLIDADILKRHYKTKKPRGGLVESRLVVKAFKTLTPFMLAACVPRRRERAPAPVVLKRRSVDDAPRAGPASAPNPRAEASVPSMAAVRAAASSVAVSGLACEDSVAEGGGKRLRGDPVALTAAPAAASSYMHAGAGAGAGVGVGPKLDAQGSCGVVGDPMPVKGKAVRLTEEEARLVRNMRGGAALDDGGTASVASVAGVGEEPMRGRPLRGGAQEPVSFSRMMMELDEDDDEDGPAASRADHRASVEEQAGESCERPVASEVCGTTSTGLAVGMQSSSGQSAFTKVGAQSLSLGGAGLTISAGPLSTKPVASSVADGSRLSAPVSALTEDLTTVMPPPLPSQPSTVVALRPTAKGGQQLTSRWGWDAPLLRDPLLPALMPRELKEAHLRARGIEEVLGWLRQQRRDWGRPPWKGRRPEGMMTNERRLAEIKAKTDGSSDNDSKNAPYSDEDERREAIREYNAANAALEACHIPAEMATVNLKDGPKSIIIQQVTDGYYKGNILIKAVVDGQKVKPWLRVANSSHLAALAEQEGGQAIVQGAGLYADTYLARGQVIGYHMGRILGPEPDKAQAKFEELEFGSKLFDDWVQGLKYVQANPELLYTWLRTYLLEYLDEADAIMSCPVDEGPCRNVRVDGYRSGIGEGWAHGETLSVKHQNKKFPIKYPAFHLHMANDAFNPLAPSGSDGGSSGAENANSTRSVLKASTHIFPGEEILWNSGAKMRERIRDALSETKEARAERKASLKRRIEKGALQLMQFVNFRLRYGHWSMPGMDDWPQMTQQGSMMARMGPVGSMVSSNRSLSGSRGSMVASSPERSAGKKAAMLAVQKPGAAPYPLPSYGSHKVPPALLYQLDACDVQMLEQVGIHLGAYGDIQQLSVHESRARAEGIPPVNMQAMPLPGKVTYLRHGGGGQQMYPVAIMPAPSARLASQSQASSQARSGITTVTIH